MPHSSPRLAAALLLLGPLLLAALLLGWLALGYRRLLLRGLRERHPAVWAELAGAAGAAASPAPWTSAGRRLARFVRTGGHYTLNDADLAAAGRLYVVTSRVGAGVALVAAAVVVWVTSNE